jgi:2-polyprenyl-6-methoxyphenol hydroxylase-like FAD-dependent oxidoreductase
VQILVLALNYVKNGGYDMENYYDVAVVGGGQVGLMTACELAIQSVKVVVLERRLNRIRNSRALTLHPRSLELMAMRGIENRFLSRGKKSDTSLLLP